jgi:hypothetical protein
MLIGIFDCIVYTRSIKMRDNTKKAISEDEETPILANTKAVFRKHG